MAFEINIKKRVHLADELTYLSNLDFGWHIYSYTHSLTHASYYLTVL